MKLPLLALLILLLCASPRIASAQDSAVESAIKNAERLRDAGQFNAAQTQLEEQLGATDHLPWRELLQVSLADVHRVWAEKLFANGYSQGAIAHLSKAYTIDSALRPQMAAHDLQEIGVVYDSLGRYEDALRFYNQALPIKRKIKDRQGEAEALHCMGWACQSLSRTEEALDFYQQALTLLRELIDWEREVQSRNKDWEREVQSRNNTFKAGDMSSNEEMLLYSQLEAQTLNNMGVAYDTLSRYQDALLSFQGALQLRRNLKNPSDVAEVLINIGTTYGNLNRYPEALRYFRQALPLFRKSKNRQNEATILGNMGLIYGYLGRQDEALRFYHQALPMARMAKDRQNEAVILGNIGLAYDKQKRPREAVHYFQSALKLARATRFRELEAETLTDYGAALQHLSRFNEAIRLLEGGLLIRRQVKDQRGEARTLHGLMQVHREHKRTELAIVFGKQSVNLYQAIRCDIRSLDKTTRDAYLKGNEHTYQDLARLLIGEGRFAEAEEVLAMVQQEEFLEFVRRDSRGMRLENLQADLLGEEKTVVAEQDLRLASVARLSEEEWQLSGLDKLTAAQRARLQEVQRLLGEARAQLNAFFAAMPARFSRNVQDIEKDKNQLSTIVPLLRSMGQESGSKVALVSAFVDDKGLELLLTLPTGQTINLSYAADAQVQRQQTFPTWLNTQVFNFKAAIERRAPVHNAATALWNVVGCKGALSAQLEGAGITTVMWRLTGPLRALPLAALRDKDGFLVEKYRNVVLTAGSSELNLAHQPQGQWKALGVGVTKAWTVENSRFDALSGVEGELQAVMNAPSDGYPRGVLPGRVLRDEKFSATNFFRLMRGATAEANAPWQVVHIASHFKLSGDNLKSFLLTGDGQALTIAELQERAAQNPLFPGVELMTLSACDTASGGKGADSLGALAELNGAKSVLATLWPVADEQTSQLMANFYRTHAQTPRAGKAAALQSAQIKLLQGGGASAHPYFWAPFVLMGNWR